MSYYATFKGMTDEVMEKYNKKNKSYFGPVNNEYKLSLKVYTLLKPEVPEGALGRVPDVKNAVFNIKLYLAGLESQINHAEEQFAWDRYKEDGYLWYCGWEFSHDQCEHTREDIYDYVVERLTILKFCAETGDYFDSESNFDEKARDINEIIEYFEDMIREIKIYEIMGELKDYAKGDDPDDEDEESNSEKEDDFSTRLYKDGPSRLFGDPEIEFPKDK